MKNVHPLVRAVAAVSLLVVSAASFAGETPRISQTQLIERQNAKDKNLVVLDVRTPAEFAAGHVPGAINISHDELPAKLESLASARDKELVVYCRSGKRSALAEDILQKAGFQKVAHLEGDWLAWEAEKRPVEKPAE